MEALCAQTVSASCKSPYQHEFPRALSLRCAMYQNQKCSGYFCGNVSTLIIQGERRSQEAASGCALFSFAVAQPQQQQQQQHKQQQQQQKPQQQDQQGVQQSFSLGLHGGLSA